MSRYSDCTKTREEFRNRFERGAMGIFHVRSGSESGDERP